MTLSEKSEAQIRERAYHIWEEAGRPDGQADLHWFLAMQEVFASPPITTPEPAIATVKTRAKKAVSAAKAAATPAKKTARKPAARKVPAK